MIVFDLRCRDSGDTFEGWFQSSADYDRQSELGLVRCPVCGSGRIGKAPMAPRLPAKSGGPSSALARLAKVQAEALKNSEWVGDRFAKVALSMHLGESEARSVHGQVSSAEAKALVEEGVPVAPLLLPLVPPSQVN